MPARANLEAIGAILDRAGHANYRTIELAGLNHLFQEAETGHPNEYAAIEQTIAPEVLEIMADWIKKQLGVK